ncbi:hypothetical protein pdul_cds_125 [Pandoravirus dulcis]|uniref:Uncharacterized protein n=1 Tax=Pandoravirus dulcis TaxID=1349409 RepID=S4VP38_9VIRU|nr:hypothetical protein pdul_cds_125 [Pandoravirus dulcis]AGO82038.1 hypothetical protein pdul_cds_125 [Pandoravirus dulcis]
MADAAPDRADALGTLSAALASLAKPPDDPYEGDREMSPTTPKAASAIRRRFARAHAVCADWRDEVLRRAAACDPRGVHLCLATMDALGANVHALSVLSARTKSAAMPGLPRDGGTDACAVQVFIGSRTCIGWWVNPDDHDDVDPNRADDDGKEDDNRHVDDDATHNDEPDVGGGTMPRSVAAVAKEPQDADPHSDDMRGPLSPHLLLSCSRLVGAIDGDRCPEGSIATDEAKRFIFEVRMGFSPDVWMTAGPVVDAETEACIDLGCLLVARDRPDRRPQGAGPLVARRRLIDFLASGLPTWAAFAARRYADLRRLPAVLAAHGWRVHRLADTPWLWSCDAGPLAESDNRSLSLGHPDLPEKMYIHLDDGRLVVSADGTWLHDRPRVDTPGVLPADPIGSMFYGDAPGFPCDPCKRNGRYHSLSHAERDMCVQRARLVGMGLISEHVLDGRTDEYIARQWDRQVEHYLFNMRNTSSRVLPPVGPDAVAQLIEAHVAQAIFGEYGPVEAVTGRRLNGGLCDDLLAAAIDTGRLCSGLRYVDKITADAYECPIDCDLDVRPEGSDRPRMLVNWRAKCTAVHMAEGERSALGAPHTEMRSVRVWVGVAVQTDGRGGACVALIVRRKGAPLDEPVDDPAADGATWGDVADRCAKGAPDHPPDLHPALAASLETERACDAVACVTPWACHTGADGPVDARMLTEWALDRVADLFKAIDGVAATGALVDAHVSTSDE